MINIQKNYKHGIALIMEGDTELCFYEEILKSISLDNNIEFNKYYDETELDYFYELSKNENIILIKMKNAKTITQITNQAIWFNNFCADKFKNVSWHVALCYDTDGKDISVFSQEDWQILRGKLKSISNVIDIIDCCAQKDVEDLFFIDIENILKFLNIDENISVDNLRGRKGKVKMKNLYNDYTDKVYHEGKRAKSLIQSLDLRKIIDSHENGIYKIENLITKILK